jgi:cell division protein FtsI (penicillin-binding protein 3)
MQTVTVPALRGGIYDRNGETLVMSIPTKQVIADDFQISDPAAEAAALSPLVHVAEAALIPKLSERAGYVVLAPNVDVADAATIEKDVFPGITMVDSSLRRAPNGALASPILGSLYASGAGSAGLEYQYQQLLAGQSGQERLFESPYGVALPTTHVTVLQHPVAGKGIELTLDAPLQFITEQALGAELVSAHALDGTAIVMDSQTGQILSMANLVNTNVHDSVLRSPAASSTSTGIPGVYEAQSNLAISQTYEPGSVFKIVPFSEGLLQGWLTPTRHFTVPDSVSVDGHLYHDAEVHPVENLTATQILAQSSNIGTYEIANQDGESGLLSEVQRLGFGQPTGLNFPGESAGLLMNAAGWEPTDIASLPIGQQDAVTPLQVLDAYNTVATGGMLVTPSLVRATIGPDGVLQRTATQAPRRVLPVSVTNTLNQMLVQVVAGGTGTEAAVPGYTIAGKTGTAQIPYPGRAAYLTGEYNATFVGFAPAQHPVLSIIVVIQRPTPVIFGGSISAPVFARIMGYALHRYGVPTSSNAAVKPPSSSGSLSLQDIT